MQKEIKLKWADGHVTRLAIEEGLADTVQVVDRDGGYHTFESADEIDAEGLDVYVEDRKANRYDG